MRENQSLKEKIKSFEKIEKDNLSRIKSLGSLEILDAESDEVISSQSPPWDVASLNIFFIITLSLYFNDSKYWNDRSVWWFKSQVLLSNSCENDNFHEIQIEDQSLGGLVGGILGVFYSRFQKKKSGKDRYMTGEKDNISLILDPFCRILNGYSIGKVRNKKEIK